MCAVLSEAGRQRIRGADGYCDRAFRRTAGYRKRDNTDPWAIIDIFIGNYKAALILAVVYALCAALREVLEAKLMGNSMGVNEFYMLAATFIGMNLFGLWGIILGPVGLVLILELLRQLKERYKM